MKKILRKFTQICYLKTWNHDDIFFNSRLRRAHTFGPTDLQLQRTSGGLENQIIAAEVKIVPWSTLKNLENGTIKDAQSKTHLHAKSLFKSRMQNLQIEERFNCAYAKKIMLSQQKL